MDLDGSAPQGFGAGMHVLVELENGRRIAGYILGWSEDGLYLNATHRESQVVLEVSDTFRADMTQALDALPVMKLRKYAVKSGAVFLALRGRTALTWGLIKIAEKEVVDMAGTPSGVSLRELSVPVMTWISSDSMSVIESTEDTMVESGVADLDSVLNQVLGEAKNKEE